MTSGDVLQVLAKFFPAMFLPGAEFLKSETASIVVERLARMDRDALTCTHANQLVHMTGEGGMSEGFFNYYFLSLPKNHPYAVDRLLTEPFEPNESGVSPLVRLRWGLHRFSVDAIMYFRSIRNAYQELRTKSHEEIDSYFQSKRFNAGGLAARGAVLPFHAIPADDRYLIAEVARKAYSSMGQDTPLLIESMLLQAYREKGGGNHSRAAHLLLAVT